MVKTLKNLLLKNQESFEAASWYTASGTQGLPSCSNDDPRMTFELLWHGQILVPVDVAILEECCMASADMQ